MPRQVHNIETIHGDVNVQRLKPVSDDVGRVEVWHDEREDGHWQLDVERTGDYEVHDAFGLDAPLSEVDVPAWVEAVAAIIGDRA